MRVYIEDTMLVIKGPKTFDVNFHLHKNPDNVSSMQWNLS